MKLLISFINTTTAFECLEKIKESIQSKIVYLPYNIGKKCHSVGIEVDYDNIEKLKTYLTEKDIKYKNLFIKNN